MKTRYTIAAVAIFSLIMTATASAHRWDHDWGWSDPVLDMSRITTDDDLFAPPAHAPLTWQAFVSGMAVGAFLGDALDRDTLDSLVDALFRIREHRSFMEILHEHTPLPAPIPGAAWLLGAGVLALVGIRSRFNLNADTHLRGTRSDRK